MGTDLSPVRRLTGRAVVVACVALACLAVLWAASAPRPAPDLSAGVATATTTPQQLVANPLAPGTQVAPPRVVANTDRNTGVGYALAVLMALFVLAVLGRVLAGLLGALLAAWRERRTVAPDADIPPDLDRVAAAVTVDADGRRVALRTGTAAEGIVAAWDRLEEALRAAGLDLPASRTSTETTVAALTRYGVDRGALTRLADLYRQACWSAHPLTEEHRARAEDALAALDRDLAPVGTGHGA